MVHPQGIENADGRGSPNASNRHNGIGTRAAQPMPGYGYLDDRDVDALVQMLLEQR